jgi:modulator of FtsH protease
MMHGWSDFLAAAAGCSGALSGLVFVALSINLARIIELPGVAARAGETILLLGSVLIGALIALMPGLSPTQLAWPWLLLWLPTWGLPTALQFKALLNGSYHRRYQAVLRLVLHQAATWPLLLAALSLLGAFSGGLRWFALAVLLSLVVALFNAWILLVEIVR